MKAGIEQPLLSPVLDPKQSNSPTNATGPSPQAIVPALATLHANGLLPAAALVDLRYQFAGELVDVEE